MLKELMSLLVNTLSFQSNLQQDWRENLNDLVSKSFSTVKLEFPMMSVSHF